MGMHGHVYVSAVVVVAVYNDSGATAAAHGVAAEPCQCPMLWYYPLSVGER